MRARAAGWAAGFEPLRLPVLRTVLGQNRAGTQPGGGGGSEESRRGTPGWDEEDGAVSAGVEPLPLFPSASARRRPPPR